MKRIIPIALAAGVGFMAAALIYNKQTDGTSPDSGPGLLHWSSVSEFLEVTKGDFDLSITPVAVANDQISVMFRTELGGDLWVYGINKSSDEITPLCGDNLQLSDGESRAVSCSSNGLLAENGDLLIFGFVTRQEADRDRIRKYLQLRAELPPGAELKALRFREAGSDPVGGLGVASWLRPTQDQT